MKRLPAMFPIALAVLLFSCNNGPAKEETKAADTTAAVTTPGEPVKPVFSPFNVVMVQHKVKDFDKWEAAYFSHDSLRKSYGISHYLIGRDLRDSNLIYVLDKMDDLAKAKTFSTLPNLKQAMIKAGVVGPPGFTYAEIVRNDDSPVEFADRFSVAHHVKNYEAWLK